MDFNKSILYGISNKKWLSELLRIEKSKLRDVRSNFNVAPFEKNVNGKIGNCIMLEKCISAR